jgi:hypothetical protein
VGRSVLVVTVAIIVAAGLGLPGCGRTAGASSSQKYGGLPSWLPKSTLPVHRVVQASATRPQLGIEGDTIAVVLAGGRAKATAVGPYDTIQGRYPVPESTPCTMVVTIADVTGTVPINPGDFTFLDELGNLYHPQVTVDGVAPPTTAPIGHSISVRVHQVLPTGSGQLRWSPASSTPIASWDFSVEID